MTIIILFPITPQIFTYYLIFNSEIILATIMPSTAKGGQLSSSIRHMTLHLMPAETITRAEHATH
jgi:hypothetical protein